MKRYFPVTKSPGQPWKRTSGKALEALPPTARLLPMNETGTRRIFCERHHFDTGNTKGVSFHYYEEVDSADY